MSRGKPFSKEKEQIVRELYKPARVNFKRRRIVIKHIGDLWQIDLAEFRNYARFNGGFNYLLVVIDCFSKYCWGQPLKTKTGEEVTAAMKKVLSKNQPPRHINSDMGREFYNRDFKNLMKKYRINHYSTYSIKKAAICERLIRSLKTNLFKLMALHGTYKWIDKIDDVILNYNNSVHRTTGLKPKDVDKSKEQEILQRLYSSKMPKDCRKKMKIGEIVRVSKQKLQFEKGYTASFSNELFKITKILRTNPTTYLLEDLDGNPIEGCFYKEELQPTKVPDVYLIEKILQKRGDKVKIKWMGFNQLSWIKASDIV